jgi:hypothetical protein
MTAAATTEIISGRFILLEMQDAGTDPGQQAWAKQWESQGRYVSSFIASLSFFLPL